MGRQQQNVNLNDLRKQQDLPEQKFLKEANQRVQDLVERVARDVLVCMRANDYAEIKKHAQHSSSTLNVYQKQDEIRTAASGVANDQIQKQAPIYDDFQAALKSHGVTLATPEDVNGLDPTVVKSVFDDHVRTATVQAVEEVMLRAYQELTTLEGRQADQEREQSRLDQQRKIADRTEANRLAAERNHETKRQAAEAEREARREAREQQRTLASAEQENADECRGNLKRLLSNTTGDKLTTSDLESWIRNGIRLAKEPESLAQKLKNTGLITYDQGLNSADLDSIRIGTNSPGVFRSIRMTSMALWVGTLAITGVAVGAGIATGGFGLAAGCFVSFLVNGANTGAQALLQKRFNDTFTNTWEEIQNELRVLDNSRTPSLTGVMYLLVDKYSPIILRTNRTKFWLPGQPSSTQAVLDHLKEACSAALNNIAQNTEGYYKGMDVKEKLNLAHTGISNLEKRWKWHFKQCDWWSTNLTVASGFGAVCFGLSLTGL